MKVTSAICDHNNFLTISDILMNKSVLIVKGVRFRLCEIEYYYRNNEHNDEYVHGMEEQKKFEGFYFHKKGNSYKSGTFKGLDITFGSEDKYFGVLIRSMLEIDNDNFIEGPCRCVNRILELFGVADVKTFMINNKFTEQLGLYDEHNGLYLKEDDTLVSENIFGGMRVGLSNKYPDYLERPYRHAIFIKRIKKQKRFSSLAIKV